MKLMKWLLWLPAQVMVTIYTVFEIFFDLMAEITDKRNKKENDQ